MTRATILRYGPITTAYRSNALLYLSCACSKLRHLVRQVFVVRPRGFTLTWVSSQRKSTAVWITRGLETLR